MNSSAGMPTWVERLLLAVALFFGVLLVLWVVLMACSALGVPLPTLDDGN